MKLAALAATPVLLVSVVSAQGVFRATTDVVVVDVAVAEGRRPIANLTSADFELRDNGVVQKLLEISREQFPLDVTLTIDMSGSMTPAKQAVVERAINQVSAALTPADRAAVTTFSTRVAERQALASPPLSVNLSTRQGGTSVLDALLLALVSAPVVDRRQLALFMTDGDDTTSYFDGLTIAETAKFASTQCSFVIVRDRDRLNNGLILTVFRTVASTTGGEMIELQRGDDLSEAFLTALANFRTSYVLRYTPAGVSPQGWHDISVRVKGKDYAVRARRGYQADSR